MIKKQILLSDNRFAKHHFSWGKEQVHSRGKIQHKQALRVRMTKAEWETRTMRFEEHYQCFSTLECF